ncbi:hypothetical protein GKC32_06260, partial [Lactobacillus curvatus]|nr:hypothetical protein [Latilactobacillus curvatus]
MQKTLMKIITTVFFIFFLFSIVFLNKTSTDDLKNKVFAASPEYLPVPSDIVPMSGILTNIAGNGPTYDSENNVLQITNRTRQVGGIWSKKKLDFSKNFVYSSYVYLGKEGSNAADGVTFTFQNDPRMETAPSSVIAGGGFALGAYGNYRNKRNGYIKNALSIEFDTYRNTGSSDAIDREVQSNDGKGHVAIIIPKPNNNTASGNHLNVQYPTDFLSNGKWRKFEISWDATDNTMTYGLEGLSNKTFKFDPLQTFGDTKAYWGFTGSTGTKSAVNAVAISQIPQKGNQLLNIVDLTTGQTLSNHGSVNAGDELEYQLDTTYIDGPEDWADVYIKINLPAGLSYVPNSIYSNGKKVSDAGSVHQQLINVGIGTLTTNQTNKLSFKAKVNDDIANKTVLVNRGLAFNENFGIGSNTIALEVVKSTAINLKKEVVNLNGVPNPKDSDYKDNVTGLPGDKFRYHIRINATNGTTDHIVFRDNDFDKDETEYWDDKADNYMLIHHNDGTSDEKVKLIGKDFADPNTIDFSKRFKSDQIGNGAYIDLYFTVGTLGILTPVGTVIPNTAHVVSTSGGDNDGHGWASNTANISLYPDPSMTKQVKLATDKASAYTDKLEASPDSDLDYRVQIKPNKDVKDPEL